jgi:hypothetical protein
MDQAQPLNNNNRVANNTTIIHAVPTDPMRFMLVSSIEFGKTGETLGSSPRPGNREGDPRGIVDRRWRIVAAQPDSSLALSNRASAH